MPSCQADIFHNYGVWINPNVQVFDKPSLTDEKHIFSYEYTSVTQSRLCLIFLMCVATMDHWTTVAKNLKTIRSLWFWHTCDLEIRSRSSKYELLDREHNSLYSAHLLHGKHKAFYNSNTYTHTHAQVHTLSLSHPHTRTHAHTTHGPQRQKLLCRRLTD